MQLIDTHTHIYLPEFNGDRDEVINRSVECGVIKLFMPNIDLHSVNTMLSVERRYPGICYPMIGLHPTSVKDDYSYQLDKLELLLTEHRFIAIGEIGIDLYWDKTRLREQITAFRQQVGLAIRYGLPVVIHSRDSFPEVFKALEEFHGENLKGVFHAFSGNSEDAERALKMGFMIGIGGMITFKNSGLDKIVKEIGPDRLILETDSPYLAPSPHRGKRNESSYLCLINRTLAGILDMSEEQTASLTFNNSIALFNL